MIFIIIWVVFGVLGGLVAQAKGKNAFLWGILCAFIPLAILILAFMDNEKPQPILEASRHLANPPHGEAANSRPAVASPLANPAWITLREFDADIQAATASLERFGGRAEERLATAYLAVSDKTLLPSMVAKITSDFEKLAAEEAQRKEASIQNRSASKQKAMDERAERSLQMIEDMKKSGMFCTFTEKRAIIAEMYFGDSPEEHGYAKIVYEDGTAELRSGRFFMPCKPDLT